MIVWVALEVRGWIFKCLRLNSAQSYLFVSRFLLLIFFILVQNADYWSWCGLLVHYFIGTVVVSCLAASFIFFFVVAGSDYSALRLRFNSFE